MKSMNTNTTTPKSLEETFYPAGMFTERAWTAHEAALHDVGLSETARAAEHTKITAVTHEVGDGVGGVIADRYLRRRVETLKPEARTAGEAAKLAAETRELEDGRVALQRVREKHGLEAGEKLLGRARRYIDSLPATKALLEETGLGLANDPAVVEAIVDAVRSNGLGFAPKPAA